MIEFIDVTWRDHNGVEVSIFAHKDGGYVMSLNGQGHIPIKDIPLALRMLADELETDAKSA